MKLNIDSSEIESEDSPMQSMDIKQIKNTEKQKTSNCHKYSKKRMKLLSSLLKIKKLFTHNKNEEKKRQSRDKNKKVCVTKEIKRKARKCKEKIKSQNSDAKKVAFHKFNEICICEMCQLFNIGEDKFAEIRGVDYIRSRERLRRKIRKKCKENTER